MNINEEHSGNIFLRHNLLRVKGEPCGNHKHNFDHTTFIIRGSINVKARSDNPDEFWEKDFKAGDHILIKAEWYHEITALEDNVHFVCIYSHRTPNGEVVQEPTGFEPAYR